MKRIAIYARVSTSDKGQDPENQLVQLREWCAHAGHTIAGEYVEHENGRKEFASAVLEPRPLLTRRHGPDHPLPQTA